MKRRILCVLSVCLLCVICFSTAAAAAPELDSGFCISLRAGRNLVYLDGTPYELTNAPFVANDIFYVPLRELVELCGGIVEYNASDKSVFLALPSTRTHSAQFFQLWVGSGTISRLSAKENDVLKDSS